MGELRKVYLPRWMTGLGPAFLLPTWGFVTYLFEADGEERK